MVKTLMDRLKYYIYCTPLKSLISTSARWLCHGKKEITFSLYDPVVLWSPFFITLKISCLFTSIFELYVADQKKSNPPKIISGSDCWILKQPLNTTSFCVCQNRCRTLKLTYLTILAGMTFIQVFSQNLLLNKVPPYAADFKFCLLH